MVLIKYPVPSLHIRFAGTFLAGAQITDRIKIAGRLVPSLHPPVN